MSLQGVQVVLCVPRGKNKILVVGLLAIDPNGLGKRPERCKHQFTHIIGQLFAKRDVANHLLSTYDVEERCDGQGRALDGCAGQPYHTAIDGLHQCAVKERATPTRVFGLLFFRG